VPSTSDYTTEYPLSPLSNNVTNANTNNITFPPQPQAIPPPLSSSPSSTASRAATNALNRALSIASKKLFGHSSPSPGHSRRSPSRDYNTTSAPSSPRRPQIITLDADAERDPLEDELLASLEELAQKTDVLTHWADEMYEYVKAIPQSMFFISFFSIYKTSGIHSCCFRTTARPDEVH
jgi:serine/threonine-protein kinase ULK/ATG1